MMRVVLEKYKILSKIKIALIFSVFMIFGDSNASLLSDIDDSHSSFSIRPDLTSLEHVQQLSSYAQTLEEQIALAATKTNIVVIGKNQTGKSTLIACLLDQPLHGMIGDGGELGFSFYNPLLPQTIRKAGEVSISSPLLPTITRLSTPWFDTWYKRGAGEVYWEFSVDPEDVVQRNRRHDGWQWIALQRIFQSLSAKIMIVTPYTSGRSSHPKLYSMLSLVTELFPLHELQKSACLVVTKSEPGIDIPIHIASISHDIATNTALVSANGKALLGYWVAQGASHITGFSVPFKEGLIDTAIMKEQLKKSLEQLASKTLSLNPVTETTALLPSSQIKAKRIHQFLKESSTEVVEYFCRDLSIFLSEEIIETPLLNLSKYWYSFTKESSRIESRSKHALLTFLTFVGSTENHPQVFIQEWEDVFGKEGRTVKKLLSSLEQLRGFPGFTDIDRAVLRQKIDVMSQSLIKSMESDFQEEIHHELIDHGYLEKLSPPTPLPAPPTSPLSSSIVVHVSFDKMALGESSAEEKTQSSPNDSQTKSRTMEISPKIASDNTMKVGTDNTFSIASPTAHVHCANLCGENPCRECCKGFMDLLRFCFSREEDNNRNVK